MNGKFWLVDTFRAVCGIEDSETLFHKLGLWSQGAFVVEWVKQSCDEWPQARVESPQCNYRVLLQSFACLAFLTLMTQAESMLGKTYQPSSDASQNQREEAPDGGRV